MRKFHGCLAAIAALISATAASAAPVTLSYYSDYSGVIRPLGGVVIFNADGTIASIGGGSVPTGTAGSPNSAVVTVQGIAGGTPVPVSAASLPLPAGAATATAQTAAQTSLTSIAARSAFATETTTPIGANLTFNGATRYAGVSPSVWVQFSCFILSDQASAAGGVRIQQSDDGTTWFNAIGVASTANVPLIVTARIFARYSRCVVVNGATAETSITLKYQMGSI